MKKRIFISFILAVLLIFVALPLPALAEGQSGTTLTANVTATGKWQIIYGWTIDKSVTPGTWNLFSGDNGTSRYTITVTKDAGTQTAWVEGQVSVTNGGAVATENLAITLDLTNPSGSTVFNSITVDVSGNPVLDPTEIGTYPYIISVPSPVAGADYKVTAHVRITNHSGHLNTPFGPNPSTTITFPASPTLINNTINVGDSNGGTWSFSASGSVNYDKTFTAAGVYVNTATIRETGQSDSAVVIVNVYSLRVTKDAATSFTRTYAWSISKSADQSTLLLTIGQTSPPVNYTVSVTMTGYTDSNWAVNGNIVVSNPAPIPAVINSVNDIVSPAIAAAINFPVSFPYTLAPSGTLVGTYTANLPDAVSRINTATAVLQNYSYDSQLNATPIGTTSFSGTAPVNFSSVPTNEVDESVAVTDTYAGLLGSVSRPGPGSFTYSRTFGPYNTYGTYQVVNTASFVANDTGATGQDSWTVTVNVPQTGGTLTQGYWKTHSEKGPAPYDDTWAQLPNGADTLFFLSGKTYYQVLWTPPQGNAYYILAHQYIAAKLNILNGASSIPEVDAAIAWATTFFNTYTPSSTLTRAQRAQAISYADTLEKYNSGVIGPGHASE